MDWFPWGDEAFEKAKAEDKPIFLSIGYSTCHWCHVMERESFEDREVADILNTYFVPVKVDREERPDIDAVYMRVCTAMTGQGGWPLTLLLTPRKEAFFAGTYFPKNAGRGMPGLTDILKSAASGWENNREAFEKAGKEVRAFLQQSDTGRGGAAAEDAPAEAFAYFRGSFDAQYGGFGRAPKFPAAHNLIFLLRYGAFFNKAEAITMAEKTLRAMYRGGIFDHIGYGFSRYSTDEKWLVPHFEKMLYDNALLIMAYLEAYRLTGDAFYSETAEKVLLYISREMTGPEGNFLCAQDADSGGTEGKYYAFRPEEIISLLGAADGEYFNTHFSIAQNGNFEGKNIPNLLGEESYAIPDSRIEALLPKVYAYRLGRTELFKDDKTLTSWNALMISAFAGAYAILGRETYLETAKKSAMFIRSKLTGPDGRLYVRYRDGEAKGTGYLDDYAFTALAFLSLYEAAYDISDLEAAADYADTMCSLFQDPDDGGFYLSAADGESLAIRPRETYDGAMPSGNSTAGCVLQLLARITSDEKWERRAESHAAFIAGVIGENPAAHTFAFLPVLSAERGSYEIVCVAAEEADKKALRELLSKCFVPDVAVLVITEKDRNRVAQLNPNAGCYLMKDGITTYYVCGNGSCSAPVTDVRALYKKLPDVKARA